MKKTTVAFTLTCLSGLRQTSMFDRLAWFCLADVKAVYWPLAWTKHPEMRPLCDFWSGSKWPLVFVVWKQSRGTSGIYIRDFSMDSKNQPTNCFPPSVEEFILLSCFYLCVTNEDLHGPVAVLINNVYNLLWASGVLSDAKQHKQRRSSKVLHHSLSVSRTRLVLVNTGGHNNLKLSSEVPLW